MLSYFLTLLFFVLSVTAPCFSDFFNFTTLGTEPPMNSSYRLPQISEVHIILKLEPLILQLAVNNKWFIHITNYYNSEIPAIQLPIILRNPTQELDLSNCLEAEAGYSKTL